ncbi:hypothetical protein [Chitinophaga sp.]|uniref:hypothetical protein n=1 Tax=Chitinophaga sp. TaxID=1869181 RepID=UPI0031DD1B80
MPDHRGFHQFYIVFLQMKNENTPFNEIVAILKLVPVDILENWNDKYDSEHPHIDPEYHMCIAVSPKNNHVCSYQKFNFDNTLDALRYELDELLYEKAQEMSALPDEEFLMKLEETTLFFHCYLTGITITPIATNNYWIGFTLNESHEDIVKQAEKAIHFYMKCIFAKKMQLVFSWN